MTAVEKTRAGTSDKVRLELARIESEFGPRFLNDVLLERGRLKHLSDMNNKRGAEQSPCLLPGGLGAAYTLVPRHDMTTGEPSPEMFNGAADADTRSPA